MVRVTADFYVDGRKQMPPAQMQKGSGYDRKGLGILEALAGLGVIFDVDLDNGCNNVEREKRYSGLEHASG